MPQIGGAEEQFCKVPLQRVACITVYLAGAAQRMECSAMLADELFQQEKLKTLKLQEWIYVKSI